MGSNTIGKVICTEPGRFQWIIDNFISSTWYKNNGVESPEFSLAICTYCIELRIERDQGWLHLSFLKKWQSPSQRLHVNLGMKTGYKGKIEFREGETDSHGEFSAGIWMQCSELLARRLEILPGGRLTVFCELRQLDTKENSPVPLEELPREYGKEVQEDSETDSIDEVPVPGYKFLKKLQHDFKNLFISKEDCDITIKVQGKEFPAHRAILRARSPVFKSMFSHEMVEKLSGEVVVDDCDPGTFPDFLNYLYTGNIKHINDENVRQLYTASDKYQVEELKEECTIFMKTYLSVDTFCDILALALRHTEKELIDLATEFFCANVTEIGKTVKWQIFLRENSTVGNELFLKAFSREKYI